MVDRFLLEITCKDVLIIPRGVNWRDWVRWMYIQDVMSEPRWSESDLLGSDFYVSKVRDELKLNEFKLKLNF